MAEKRKKPHEYGPATIRERGAAYKTRSAGEELWRAFQALPDEERAVFLRKLLDDDALREDLADSIVMIEREGEPSRPFEEFVEELRREGRL
ncbi:MAG: hypothetical protein Q7T33_03250 [Dehalococcoidia bacterium]|nr:hypothetical protein [Dehalococcoidia bacterium]